MVWASRFWLIESSSTVDHPRCSRKTTQSLCFHTQLIEVVKRQLEKKRGGSNSFGGATGVKRTRACEAIAANVHQT